MKHLDLTLPTPAENLACDEALIDLCEEGGEEEILRFWEPTEPFVVVGYANQAALEVNLEACQTAGLKVFRRCSGGGTVVQGGGCLNYSVILRIQENGPLQSIAGTNHYILGRQQAALEPLVQAKIQIQGHTDLAIRNLKFSGNAQRRKRKYLLFHGTFLLHFDIPLIEKVLRMPSKQPDYRRDRPHTEFLTNLNQPAEAVKSVLKTIWRAEGPFAAVPLEKIDELARQKYSTDDWNLKF